MSAVPFSRFETLDVTRFRQTLAKLHEAVGCGKGRIEVTRRGCTDACVLISKAELESLEQALEIMSASAEFKAMCDQIQQLVVACNGCDETPKAAADVPDAAAERA